MIGVKYDSNLQAKSVVEVAANGGFASSILGNEAKHRKDATFTSNEPISVLDTRRSSSPCTSTSTLSSLNSTTQQGATATSTKDSSAGGGKEELVAEMQPGGLELSQGFGLEKDWESLLSEPAGQGQTLIRWISGDSGDSSLNLKQPLAAGSSELQGGTFSLGPGFQAFSMDCSALEPNGNVSSNLDVSNLGLSGSGSPFDYDTCVKISSISDLLALSNCNAPNFPSLPPALTFQQLFGALEPEVNTFNHGVIQNASNLNVPNLNTLLSIKHQEQQIHVYPQHNQCPNVGSGNSNLGSQRQKVHFVDHELSLGKNQSLPQMLQSPVSFFQQPTRILPNKYNLLRKPLLVPKQEPACGSSKPMVGPGHHHQQHQQIVYDLFCQAAESILARNFSNAQGILARLNHILCPIVKQPFDRSASYFKEALQLALLTPNNNLVKRIPTPFDGMLKMGAYMVFSEVSPLIQFINFTANQTLLEAIGDAECIHIVDFDIGFGDQWSSFVQELPRKHRGVPSLKITAFASPRTHHSIEISLIHENLTQFANDFGIDIELEVVNIDSFDPNSNPVSSFRTLDTEVIVVNFPIWSFASDMSKLPSYLRFIKDLAPKIVVSLDHGCERTDLPFTHHMLHALQYYEVLLDSIDSVQLTSDASSQIEKFLFQSRIENTVLGRLCSPDPMPLWRNLFAFAGFLVSPISNFAETQAECMVSRTQVTGFHLEKKHASLVLCWQHQELMSVSAWRC